MRRSIKPPLNPRQKTLPLSKRQRRRRMLLRQRPMRLRRRKWSRSGGPVAVRKNVGRVMIAIVTAIRNVPQKVLRLPWPLARPAKPPNTSGTGADGATATMISANPAPMRRSKPRRRQRRTPRRFANRARTRSTSRASASRARAGTPTSTRVNSEVATRADAKKADATSAPTAGRRIGSSPPQRRPRERDRPVDPNSPFAKLAALKEQLTANRKDQR